MAALWLRRGFLLMVVCALVVGSYSQRLCGAELVDAIQFVCGERRVASVRSHADERRLWDNILKQCCHAECTIEDLEKFCKTLYQRT